ncbi:MAG: response regulator transcription factor [Actinomycetota bacterium]
MAVRGELTVRILVIEDDEAIGHLVRMALERDGQDVVHAMTAAEGLEFVDEWGPDVIILDLMLPDMSGFDVARRVREDSDVPIVMLTAKGQDSDKVTGLDIGADDYIVKPFSVSELTARIRAVARRTRGEVRRPSTSLSHRDLALDADERRVLRGSEEIALTKREFEVLRMLMQQAGKLVTRSAIAHAVWGRPASSAKNLLDVHMSALRKKLEDRPEAPVYIETVRGEGFRLID